MKEDKHYLLKHFVYAHLPPDRQEISKQFCDLAAWIDNSLKDGSEKTVALRKLLEAKDAAVRTVNQ